MSIVQFLRIIWARRLLIGAATLACLVGAVIVTLILPPRWEATTRVMMGLLKPDPVTGQVITGPATRAYVATQTELVTDYSVAGQVPDQLGWLSDPGLIATYDHRSSSDKRDFRRWLADMIIARTKAQVLEGSNILEITYTATRPDDAKGVADALRKAYIDASLAFKRDEATRNADWFDTQANTAKVAVDRAEADKAAFEKANGIVMADDNIDLDTARLRALAAAGVAQPAMVTPAATSSPASIQLAQIDASITEAAKTIGPNHPQMQALKAERAVLAQQAAQDQAAARAQAGAAASAAVASAGAIDRAVQTASARVVAKSDKLANLAQLQNQVNVLKEQFTKTAEKAADFRQQAAIADTGLTPLSNAVTPKAPVFPNYWLIIPGSLALGLGTGVLVALLAELFNRRVRGVEDLKTALHVPLLAVVAPPPKPPGKARLLLTWAPKFVRWGPARA
jgi:uncharacterized protein involved in exopolysaccharide biosynthesis